MVNPYYQQTVQKKKKRWAIALEIVIAWIETHRERFWTIVCTVAVVMAMSFVILQNRRKQNEQAWTQLGTAQALIMQNNYPEARKALDDWEAHFRGTSADTYARFLRADLLYGTSNYVEAAATYARLAAYGTPAAVRPLALSGETASEEMAGHYPQAAALAQRFIDQYPDHYLAGSMWMTNARLQELTGNISTAVSTYNRLQILYPQSPGAALAKNRLEALAATTSQK